MNLAPSLVESYMYADMFNSDNVQNFVGGAPVEHILPSITRGGANPPSDSQEEVGGPLKNKVVPAGLVVIHSSPTLILRSEIAQTHRTPVEYDECAQERDVLPDNVFDILLGSMMKKPADMHKRRTPPKRKDAKKMSKKKLSKKK